MDSSITSKSTVPSPYPIKPSESVEIPDPAATENVTKMFLSSFMIEDQENSLNHGTINTNMYSQ